MNQEPVPTAEEFVAELSRALTAPAPRECVFCYSARMIGQFGCDTTLRWALRWRDLRVPTATGLQRRLESRGGFCDCEIFMNGWTVRDDLLVLDPVTGDLDVPPGDPVCEGVSAGSSRGCRTWVPIGRGSFR